MLNFIYVHIHKLLSEVKSVTLEFCKDVINIFTCYYVWKKKRLVNLLIFQNTGLVLALFVQTYLETLLLC